MKRGGLIALAVFLILLIIGIALTITYTVISISVRRPQAPDSTLVTYPPGFYLRRRELTRFEVLCDYDGPHGFEQIKWKNLTEYTINEYGNPYVQNFQNLSSKLIFGPGSIDMNGFYTCYTSSKRAEIAVSFYSSIPQFDKPQEDVNAYEGYRLELKCHARSERQVDYSWYDQGLNAIEITDNVYVTKSADSSSLVFENFEDHQNVAYFCNATNMHGSALQVFFVKVVTGDGRPKFKDTYRSVVANTDEKVELNCEAEGVRPMNYTWYNQDEEVISSYESLPVHSTSTFNGSALIFASFQENEKGLYTCLAKNSLGLGSKVFRVEANGTGGAPEFEKNHQNVTVVKGSKVELLCCDPRVNNATYKWMNQHEEVLPQNSTFPVHVSPTERGSVLTISAMESNYSGVYTCHASNFYGNAVTEFEVQIDPVSESAPNFKEEYETVFAKEKSKLEILCLATGDSPIEYTWYNEDSEIVVNDTNLAIYVTHDSVEGSLLTILEAQKKHSGSYTCSARNGQGLQSKVYHIVVYEKPDEEADENIHFAKVLKVTVDSVLFAIATQESVDSIEVRYNETWKGDLRKKTFKKSISYEIKDLVPGAVYNFSFRVYGTTNGSWSDVYRVPLLPRTPEVIFRLVREDMVEVELFTTVDERMRGATDKYELSYRTVQIQRGDFWEPSKCAVTIVKPACSGTRFTIAALERNLYYELAVRGHTEAGYGEPYIQKFFLKGTF